jgi:hypothetical protein
MDACHSCRTSRRSQIDHNASNQTTSVTPNCSSFGKAGHVESGIFYMDIYVYISSSKEKKQPTREKIFFLAASGLAILLLWGAVFGKAVVLFFSRFD